jgi:20S proteasome subunit beta 2
MDLGFDFSLFARNQSLEAKGRKHNFKKTGTTIAAAVFDGGVVLGADTRVTTGTTISCKEEPKLHQLSDNIWCGCSGTSADTIAVTSLCAAHLRLFRLNTGRQPRVDQAAADLVSRLFPYGGHISAALILGGVDFRGPSVYNISPDGCVAQSPFTVMGSGSYAAISVLENGWRIGLPIDAAKELVADAIEAGITNDLGSGSDVNLCVITANGSEYLQRYRVTNKRPFKSTNTVTAIQIEVIRESSRPLSLPEVHLEILDGPPQ